MIKKLLGLFFEEDSQETRGGNNGYFLVSTVWGSILLVNGISEYFTEHALIDSWFMILMMGLIVFFAAEAFAKKTGQNGE